MNTELTLDTLVDIKIDGAVERFTLNELYRPEKYDSVEDFFAVIEKWIQTGNCFLVDTRSREEKASDKIFEELASVNKAKAIEQDRKDREDYKARTLGVYGKVGFPAKSLLDAQEMHQMIIRNYNIRQEQLGIDMQGSKILVTITDCPTKTYVALDRTFGFKRGAEAVSGAVDKTAKTALNMADTTLNTVAVPVAKTAIGTSAKVAKSLFGFGAKLAGIAVGETVKATKQCISEVKTDGYIAEAKGEVVDGVHAIKRTVGKTSFGSNGGVIIE